MARAIKESGFVELSISTAHAQVAKLPLLNDHKDTFDRLLVWQSMSEPLVLLSVDPQVHAYGGLARAV
jgi:PIN domain nuclease of toxin-antitoxin system